MGEERRTNSPKVDRTITQAFAARSLNGVHVWIMTCDNEVVRAVFRHDAHPVFASFCTRVCLRLARGMLVLT